MARTTEQWEAELARVTSVENVFNPGHISAVEEVVRLRWKLEDLAEWHGTKAMKARDFPWPGGQHAARFRGKAESHETARAKINDLLKGDSNE